MQNGQSSTATILVGAGILGWVVGVGSMLATPRGSAVVQRR